MENSPNHLSWSSHHTYFGILGKLNFFCSSSGTEALNASNAARKSALYKSVRDHMR